MAIRLIVTIGVLRIIYIKGGIYTPDDSSPDGVITKYLKGKTEVSCLLQCERDEQCDKTMFKMKNKQSRSGECWFVKEVSNGTKDEVKKLKQDILIKSFKKLPFCGKTPCFYGRCVKTDDSKRYKCQCKENWTLLKQNVCFGARANQFGRFKVQQDAVMTGIKLHHVGGVGVTCYTAGAAPTKWGCLSEGSGYVCVIISVERNILYPSMKYHISNGYYAVPGYNANSPYLIFNASYHKVHKGQELRLYYGEDFHDFTVNNNGGESCADIFATFCDA
ncbi:uncharacterized protein LOC130613104 [Hydractinia symbiolongicarpus]|uniref:uncharacterized protein LOC130613104 n=1 Tax=Hydractinia symbiolongicarpus TaxID=13093 RepID=UPI00254B14BB|nr:uncharacterized protein LOC130613104 [Hydractinia symbiolongicarpus]